MNETVEFSQSAQHSDSREIGYSDNDFFFFLARLIMVMLESCASKGLSRIIWGDMCSIVFENQEIVLANKKDFKLTCSLSIIPTPLPFCSATKGIITHMQVSEEICAHIFSA